MDELRAADRMSRTGWIEDPDDLAVERLLLLDETVLEAVVRRELGPLLDTPRMGPELVLTLQSYFESGENMRETSRAMNLATRTIAYRLTRVEEILGRPLDGELRARLAVALFAYRVLGDGGSSPADGLRPDV
jgi:DNA-binding PucR family transcriptional regulator